jgi:hypothetical protein
MSEPQDVVHTFFNFRIRCDRSLRTLPDEDQSGQEPFAAFLIFNFSSLNLMFQ